MASQSVLAFEVSVKVPAPPWYTTGPVLALPLQAEGFDVAFQAEQQIAGLPVVAGLEAPSKSARLDALHSGGINGRHVGVYFSYRNRHCRTGRIRLPHVPPAVPPI